MFRGIECVHESIGWRRAERGHSRGGEIKRQLVRAALAGCDAILEVDASARFLQRDAAMTDAPGASSDLAHRDAQFETWDMLAGRLAPQLGGHPRYLDIDQALRDVKARIDSLIDHPHHRYTS